MAAGKARPYSLAVLTAVIAVAWTTLLAAQLVWNRASDRHLAELVPRTTSAPAAADELAPPVMASLRAMERTQIALQVVTWSVGLVVLAAASHLLRRRRRERDVAEAERRRAEEALRESEARYRSLVELAPDTVVVHSEGLITYINPSGARSFGASSPAAMIGKPIRQFVHPDSWETVNERVRRVQQDNEPAPTLDLVFRRLDGRDFDVEVSGVPLSLQGKTASLSIIRDITERRKASDEMARFFRLTPALLAIADPNGRFLRINTEWERTLGFSEAEVLEMGYAGLIHPDDLERTRTEVERQLAGQTTAHFKNRYLCKDGSYRLLEWHASPSVDGALYAAATDITERTRGEDELRHSTALLKNAEFAAHLGYYEIDLRTGRATWSEETFRLFGLDPSSGEPTVESYRTLLHPEDADTLFHAFDDCIKQGSDFDLTYRIVHSSGEFRYVHSIGHLELDASGAAARMVGTLQDVTEFKQAEEALHRAATEWQATFDAVGDGIWLLDAGQRIVRTNAAGCSMFQRSTGKVEGRRCWEIAHGTASPPADCPFLRARQSLGRETVELVQDERRFSVSVDPILDGMGQLAGAVHLVRDITEHWRGQVETARLEAQLQQAQKLESVGRLAGGVAHDFNNMLEVILGHSELALGQLEASHPVHGNLRQIEKAARHSAGLTSQLLAFARRQTVSPKVLNLNDTVAPMLKILQRLIGEDITLVWTPGASLWPVKIDPTQIDQILANLSVNARDAIQGVGRLAIETRNRTFAAADCLVAHEATPGDYVVLVVSDNGSGMSQEVLDRIFEPFFTTKELGRGTGLGLATVYGIVRQNGGFVTVSSELGVGTTFRVHLPRHAGAPTETLTPTPVENLRARGETVLLVEDARAILALATEMLKRQGYTVLAAGKPEDALHLARTHAGEIHLILTDVVMPAMNGPDLVTAVTSLRPGIKSLFMSGYTADAIADRGVLDDDVQFIQKPFTQRDLASKVRQVLDRKHV